MAKIDELERKILELENQLKEERLQTQTLLAKSEKALETALHAYKVDHFGFIWVYQYDTNDYVRTDMRIMSPELVDKAVKTQNLADGAVTSEKIQEDAVGSKQIGDGEVKSRNIAADAVTSDKIGDKEVKGRNIAPGAIGAQHIVEKSIYGDHFDGESIKNGPLADDAVAERNMQADSVGNRALQDKSVSAEKLADNVLTRLILPLTQVTDEKFTNITNELYSMIRSLQVGGIALSQQFGNRTDIGISQKTLTKAFGRFWDEMSEITGKDYMDFKLTVAPTAAYTESAENVTITADCREAISDFDSIKVYINNTLVAESSDIEIFTTQQQITETSEIKAVGTILGKTITKTQQVIKEIPFFMGGGAVYQDIMTMEYHKVLEGTLEGDYDLTVKHDGEHMFIIIPASHKSEFRRANMKTPDMGGYEIPLDLIYENQDYVVYKSQTENGYIAGTYNIDININS